MPDTERPILAVLAVLIRGDQVLLVQRANPPDAGRWGFAGGKVELGETLQEAAERELLEETGVRARAGDVIGVIDVLERASDGRLLHHFVLIALHCHWRSDEPVAADDAQDARWIALKELETTLPLSRDVATLARQAAEAQAK
ncbi:MAG TPA: NUDIX hydrolase [Paracoccus sp.]|nr:NUDIX hydrolase [Paracoccus sp. (in: a-proteobacteria)]